MAKSAMAKRMVCGTAYMLQCRCTVTVVRRRTGLSLPISDELDDMDDGDFED